jgi:hypothetical protein
MAKATSRTGRWREACQEARNGLQRIEDAKSEIETAQTEIQSAFEELQSIKEEYEEWESGLIDAARGTALEEKLQAVSYLDLEPDTDIDVDIDVSAIEAALDEAEGADLPLGFGRD